MPKEPIKTEGVIVAKPARDYRWRRYGLVAVLFLYGLYSAYDGFYHYPKDNAEFHKAHPLAENLPHPALDIPFNQAFGIGLPPLALVFLGWVLYASRGCYRYDGNTLSVPGHENTPVKSIRKIDKSKWDRKGIAYLQYQVAGSAKLGTIKLDDFIYQRIPTDAIFAHIEAAVEAAKTPVMNVPQQSIACPHCGTRNLATASQCTNCGQALSVADQVSE
jgi:hypothetical protein